MRDAVLKTTTFPNYIRTHFQSQRSFKGGEHFKTKFIKKKRLLTICHKRSKKQPTWSLRELQRLGPTMSFAQKKRLSIRH